MTHLRKRRMADCPRISIAIPASLAEATDKRLKSREGETTKGVDEIMAAFGRETWKEYNLLREHLVECSLHECRTLFVHKGYFSRQKYCSRRCQEIANRRARIDELRQSELMTTYLAMLDKKMRKDDDADMETMFGPSIGKDEEE
jgi:hypothetical protein